MAKSGRPSFVNSPDHLVSNPDTEDAIKVPLPDIDVLSACPRGQCDAHLGVRPAALTVITVVPRLTDVCSTSLTSWSAVGDTYNKCYRLTVQ
ncbi:hypothetical protein BaRGS_00004598 [Batillaria attramentaria]|uniref:Uncharacterized protein n=1 Tax=Batillaria attramentaria TaxID=370345 RepID=A0ABD0LZ59_9CAEN